MPDEPSQESDRTVSASPTAVTWKLFATITCRAAGNAPAVRAPSAGVVRESNSPDSTRVSCPTTKSPGAVVLSRPTTVGAATG